MPSIDILDYKRISVLSPEPQVLCVGGSPRKTGNSDVLLKYILADVGQRRLATQNVQLRAFQFQACIGCEKCRRAKVKKVLLPISGRRTKVKLKLGSVVFAAADVDVDIFLDRLPAISEIAEQVVITVSDNDNALKAAKRYMEGEMHEDLRYRWK